MAEWQDTVDTDAALQEREFDARRQRAADWQDTTDMDAALQARDRPETPWGKLENPYAAKAAALRAAAGLPAIGPVHETPAGGMTSEAGEPLLLRATGAPTMAEPSVLAPEAGSPIARAIEAGKSAVTGAPGAAADLWRRANAPLDAPPAAGPPMPPPAAPAPPPPSAGTPAAIDATVAQATAAINASRAARGLPPEAPGGAAIFHDAPAGGGGRPVGNDRAALVAQAVWDERQAALARLAKGGGTYRIPARDEYEQKTDVHRERALGYDPAILERQMALETGPERLTEEAARPQQAPPVAYDPKILGAMIAPPPEAKTPAQREAYFAEVASKAAASGQSLQSLLASGEVKLAAPRGDLMPRGDAEAKVYSDAHKAAFAAAIEPWRAASSTPLDLQDRKNSAIVADADRDAKAAAADALNRARIMENAGAIDKTNATTRRTFDEQEAQRLRQRETNVQNYGKEGQVGFEKEKLRIEAQGHEATADAEREMAKVAGDAVAAGEKLRAKADEQKPGVMQSILGIIGAGLGAFGQGMVGGPNQYIQNAQHRIESQAKSLTDDVAVQKGVEISRYEQIKHNLQAKLAMGMSENAQNAAKQMLGKVEIAQLAAMKELSAMTRGSEKVASKVIPARAASVGGGAGPQDRLKILLAMRGDEEANAKLAKEQGGEPVKKGEKQEVGVLGGTTYHLDNVTSTAEGHEVRKKLAAMDGIMDGLKVVEEAAASYGQRGYNPSRLENAVGRLGAKISIGDGMGVMTNPEADRNVKSFSSWTDPKSVIADTRRILQADRNALLKQLGAVPVKR